MKLIIQIPCLNEASSLAIALSDLPREVPGFDVVEWLVIDDGSDDNTVEIARKNGVDHIVRHTSNRGLAHAFMTGIDACLAHGADVIVNTDADNQYDAEAIPALIQPILDGDADMVVGTRPIKTIQHFSAMKKALQFIGSWVVRFISGTNVSDATSGFRAISKSAALQLVVFSNYTYTLETIIQAGQKNLQIANVPVRVNGDLRPSRLLKSTPSYIRRSIATMLRIFIIYRPARVFGTIAALFFAVGLLLGVRFLFYWLVGEGDGKIQSLILAAIMTIMGFQALVTAFLADVIAANRRLLEELRYTQRRLFLKGFEETTEPSRTAAPPSAKRKNKQ